MCQHFFFFKYTYCNFCVTFYFLTQTFLFCHGKLYKLGYISSPFLPERSQGLIYHTVVCPTHLKFFCLNFFSGHLAHFFTTCSGNKALWKIGLVCISFVICIPFIQASLQACYCEAFTVLYCYGLFVFNVEYFALYSQIYKYFETCLFQFKEAGKGHINVTDTESLSYSKRMNISGRDLSWLIYLGPKICQIKLLPIHIALIQLIENIPKLGQFK